MPIRTATKSDMPSLLEIYNYEVLHGTATFDLTPKTLPERMEWFHAHNTDNHPLIVEEIDGIITGYASLSSYRDKEAYAATVELSVYVSPGHRRRGTARRLMSALLEEARTRDDIHTVISVITAGNEASIKLHQEFGFTHCGTIQEVGQKFGQYLNIANYQLMV